ncbi:2,4-dihydroxyhept-2-ene-1,7-dioic acid aldolase [Alcaligenaceae bacterium CGII-47]|nr:2,4-dihydroxyhept-2-ene-1,7-dioic acid aldolase [Alcaligenaceae bacterium CGII-47]
MNHAAPAHRLRAHLLKHEPQLVLNVDHPSAGLVEALARSGADALMFDTEQGSPDIESLENMARAARLHGVCSLIRTFNLEPWAIERLMHRGADGIIVPRAESLDDVRRIVASFDYCLSGERADRILIVQLEHAALLDHLDELAQMRDIDCIFIGPIDLSKSMGHRGAYDQVEVAGAIQNAIRVLRQGGMPVGMLVKPGDVAPWVRLGVSFLYAHANDLLNLGAQAMRNQIDL